MDGQAYLQVIERRLERYFDKKALVQGSLQLIEISWGKVYFWAATQIDTN